MKEADREGDAVENVGTINRKGLLKYVLFDGFALRWLLLDKIYFFILALFKIIIVEKFLQITA